MLGNDYFYFSLFRKYQTLFGSLFNDIVIERSIAGANNNPTQIIDVPLEYEQKEKSMVRVKQDPDIDKTNAIILPRMSFFLDGFTYDSTRSIPTLNKFIISEPNSQIGFQYAPSPWDLKFSLYIFVKNTEDANKILEQILPYFKPSFVPKVYVVPNRPSVEIPIILERVTHSDTDDQFFKDRSILIWELNFTMKAYLYGPVANAHLIDLVNVSFYYGDGPVGNTVNVNAFGISANIIYTQTVNSELDNIYTITPGLYANGSPTSNSAQSIPIANIVYTSNYGIVEVINSTPWSN